MKKGFTLIELLVVIAIIAILAAILFPVFAQAREKARQSMCGSNIRQIGMASQMYLQDFDEMYPMYQYSVAVAAPPGFCRNEFSGQSITIGFLLLLQPYSKNNLYSRCPTAKEANESTAVGRRLACEGRIGYGMAYPTPGWFAFNGKIENPAGHLYLMDSKPDGSQSLPIHESTGAYMNHVTTPFGAYQVSGAICDWHQRPHARHNEMVMVCYIDGHAGASPFQKVYGVRESQCEGINCCNLTLNPANYPELWELWK
ncbi:MAG: prepilin-type N-terminal cleavage/methylation domain-containing protein [Armatimonadetes bacterium]|nr:prepilin-type N-terminal cleavage/methylation domain-containing protein [Armatimonadota bacterium]